ncbi:hypothetical protein F5B17DRAFT_387957, partial [Nemania serpens]
MMSLVRLYSTLGVATADKITVLDSASPRSCHSKSNRRGLVRHGSQQHNGGNYGGTIWQWQDISLLGSSTSPGSMPCA